MMNQVKTQKVKIGRSQIIAKVEVSKNLIMDSDSYNELQLVAASERFSLLAPVRFLQIYQRRTLLLTSGDNFVFSSSVGTLPS